MKRLFSITKKDLEISYFSGRGAGGQHRNRHMNCVRIKHKDSGATATGQTSRSRKQNLRAALSALVSHHRFKLWLSAQTYCLNNDKTIDEIVERELAERNLKIEVFQDGKWEIE